MGFSTVAAIAVQIAHSLSCMSLLSSFVISLQMAKATVISDVLPTVPPQCVLSQTEQAPL